MIESQIEWTRWVWDFLRGCSRVSPGCENCYAERYAYRFSGPGLGFEGLARLSKKGEPRWTGKVRAHAAAKPLALERKAAREGVRSRVFVNSKSDTFHERAPLGPVVQAYDTMRACPHLDFLVLTKRVDRMLAFEHERFDWHPLGQLPKPLPRNIWHGTSIENQRCWNERAPLIAQSRAAVRFVSVEPLLERIDMRPVLAAAGVGSWYERGSAIDWVIVGGESASRRRARKTDIAAIESIVEQCDEFGIPVFVKQLGTMQQWPDRVRFSSKKGGDFDAWPKHLQRREMPRLAA